jgi:hypothetical protein
MREGTEDYTPWGRRVEATLCRASDRRKRPNGILTKGFTPKGGTASDGHSLKQKPQQAYLRSSGATDDPRGLKMMRQILCAAVAGAAIIARVHAKTRPLLMSRS